jgi:hypothetical protein
VSDLGPAIVTGSVAVLVATAGFISTGLQAARTQRVQDRASLRDEKRRAYANCMAALHAARDAAYYSRWADAANQLLMKPQDRPDKEEAARAASKANTDLMAAISALTLVAPDSVANLAWEAASVIDKTSRPGGDSSASNEAVARLLRAMRADLGYSPN